MGRVDTTALHGSILGMARPSSPPPKRISKTKCAQEAQARLAEPFELLRFVLVRRFRGGVMAAFLAIALSGALAFAADAPSLGGSGLAAGALSSMHMVLKKYVFKVGTIEVKVGPAVQEKFKQVLGGKPYSPALEGELAKIALGADRAVIQFQFARSVSLDQWLDGVRESLAAAEKAGLVSSEVRKQVSEALPAWFEPVKARGYKEGDRVLYDIGPSGLRTVAVTRDGQLLVDRTEAGIDKGQIVLASYFAPGTEYRKPLLSSLK
jgi:hypothetical protein